MSAPNRFKVAALITLLLAAMPLWALTYVPLVEWNGTQLHVMNSSGLYNLQPVDDPIVDVPFSNPIGVAAWYDGANYYSYVVDAFLDRVQFFVSDIAYDKDATTGGTGTLTYNAVAAAAGQFGGAAGNVIRLNSGGVVRGSELLIVDGNSYIRVNSLAGYTSADYVYTVVYEGAPATGGVFTLPNSSLTSASVVSCEYAYSSTAATNLVGDIDFATAAAVVNGTVIGNPFEINEAIPSNTGHPTAFENLVAIAYTHNMAAADVADIYLLDAGEIGSSVVPKLYTFKVENDAATTFEYVDTYDNDALSQPLDVCFAETGTANALVQYATATTITGGLAASAADPSNNALVTNHTYTLTVVTAQVGGPGVNLAGVNFNVTDNTTGNVIGRTAALVGAGPNYEITDAVPGVAITITSQGATNAAATQTITLTLAAGDEAYLYDYIFICDTGNDRIKILKAGENNEPESGAGLNDGNYDIDNISAGIDLFADDNDRWDYYGASDGSANQMFVASSRPMEGTYAVYTKATLAAADSTEWTIVDNLAGSGPSDTHCMFDYDTQVLTFGDGNFGDIPTSGYVIVARFTPCIDVIDYGSTGTSTGRFNAPGGIAARYNTSQGWFDIYVADSDNNRIVKLKFDPPTLNQTGTVEWVTSWTATVSGGTALDSPTDLAVGETTGNEVYLFVCDTGNDRVVVYEDIEAENDGAGGTTAPTVVTSFGANGSGLGQFSHPVGISIVANGAEFDVYVTDGERNNVTKYATGVDPEIDVDYSNISSYGYLPTGSYTFTKQSTWSYLARNYPTGAYIKFFYSDTTTAGQASPSLCSSSTYTAATTSWTWTFASTPGGAPDDGDYYLYARLYDSNGVQLDEDKSPASSLLTIDSDLLTGIGGIDSYDSDKYFYLQNGSLRTFDLIAIYPDSVGSINYTGTFPADVVQITNIEEGPAWQTVQNQGVIFESDWDNTNGTFEVSTAVLGSNTGLVSGPPTYTLAIVTVQVASTAVTPASRTYIDDFDITSGMWADYTGSTLASPTLNDLSLRIGYLGDIADELSNRGILPNLIPNPDGHFGIDDIVVFTMAWNGIGGTQDPIADLAPYDGTVPNIWASPDGNIDVLDLMAFTLMFDWYQAQTFTTAPRRQNSGAGNIASVNGAPTYVGADAWLEGNRLVVSIDAKEVEELMTAELSFTFDSDVYNLDSYNRGDFLLGEGSGFFKGYEREGGFQLYLSRLNPNDPGVNGSGEIARLEFIVPGELNNDIEVSFDLRNSHGDRIEAGSMIVGLNSPAMLPLAFTIEKAYPNPFNPTVTVPFSLPDPGAVKIAVFDVLGREVYAETRQYGAGHHRFVFGQTQSGSALSAGVYLLRFEYGDQIRSQKIVFMK